MIPYVIQYMEDIEILPIFWVTEPSCWEHLCWNSMETLYYQMINYTLIIEIAGYRRSIQKIENQVESSFS